MNRRGFTLLETVVAITLLSAIAGIVALAIRLASSSIERGEAEVARMARLKGGIDIIERAIRSSDPTKIPLGDNTSAYFRGEPDRIRFLSLAPASMGGFRLVCFRRNEKPAKAGLTVADASPFRPEGADAWEGEERARVLIPEADGLSFSYSPGPSPEGAWEWREKWDFREEGTLPGAVRVEFATPSENGSLKTSLVIPVFAEAGS